MAIERCPATKDGQQCVLTAGHTQPHELPADPGWALPTAAPVPGSKSLDGKPVQFGCLSLIAIAAWTIVGIVVFGVILSVLGGLISLVDPQVNTDDNPIAFLMLLALPLGPIVPFVGSVLTIRWLRKRRDPQAST